MTHRLLAAGLSLAAVSCALDSPKNAVRPMLVAAPQRAASQAGASAVAPPPASTSEPSTVIRNAPPSADSILRSSCATKTEQSSLLPSNLLFLVDRSGSMSCNPPPITTSDECETNELRADVSMPSKWELTRRAVLTTMTTLSNTNALGISYFSNDSRCGVSSVPNVPLSPNSVAQRDVIASSFAGITPSGSTPLVGATLLAYKYLHQNLAAGLITGNSYVVLITDGEQSESCSDPMFCSDAQACSQLLVEQAAVAARPDVNIRTFVVGVPGSERGSTVLSRLAKAGGTALKDCDPEGETSCHFDISQETDLESALQQSLQKIAGQTFTCELEPPKLEPGVALDLTRLNVVFTPHQGPVQVIPQDLTAPCDGGAQGWQFDEGLKLLHLCGQSCNAVRGDRGGRIDVVLGCPVVGPD
jgi:hypothetical protein